MKRTVFSLAAAAIAASATMALVAAAAEKKHTDQQQAAEVTMIKLDRAPSAVQAAIKQAVGSAKVATVEKETAGGVTMYEAAWKVGEVDHGVVVNNLGDVMEKEMAVSGKAIPKAVRKAAMKRLPKGAQAEFELKTVMLYEVEAMVNGKEVELLVDPSGRVLELEADDDHEDHDGEDDDDDDDDHEDQDHEDQD
jgi:hypothetical protein